MGRPIMRSFCGKLRVDAKRNSVTRKDWLRAEKSGVQCRAYSPDPRFTYHHHRGFAGLGDLRADFGRRRVRGSPSAALAAEFRLGGHRALRSARHIRDRS